MDTLISYMLSSTSLYFTVKKGQAFGFHLHTSILSKERLKYCRFSTSAAAISVFFNYQNQTNRMTKGRVYSLPFLAKPFCRRAKCNLNLNHVFPQSQEKRAEKMENYGHNGLKKQIMWVNKSLFKGEVQGSVQKASQITQKE